MSASTSRWLDESSAVSDPSDWLGGPFAYLRDLDASLRCEICSDILRAPVSIKTCSHTFCSRCIRDYINQPSAAGAPTERPCPNCRQPKVYDSELVPVPQLEVAAEAWRSARLHLSQRNAEDIKQAAELESNTHKKRKAGESHDTVLPSESSKLRKVSSSPPPEARRVTRSANKSSRSPSRTRNGVSSEDPPQAAIIVDDDSDEDWSVESDTQSPSKRRHLDGSAGGKSLKDMTASDVVECPLCGYTFTVLALNRHLDAPQACKGPDGPPPSDRDRGLATKTNGKSSTPGFGGWLQKGKSVHPNGKPSPLAHAVKLKRPQYHLLSEQKLRRVCEEHGLNTTGSRNTLESRHRRWIDLYNANLDASEKYRRSENQLRKEVREWDAGREREESRLKKAANGVAAASTGKGKNPVGASEEQRRAYTVTHASHFRELVAQSRKTHVANKQAHAAGAPHDTDDQGDEQTDPRTMNAHPPIPSEEAASASASASASSSA